MKLWRKITINNAIQIFFLHSGRRPAVQNVLAVYIRYRGWAGEDFVRYHNQFCLGVWICCIIYVTVFPNVLVLDAKTKLHLALYSSVYLWPLTPVKLLMIANNVREALGRLVSYIKIVIGI